MITVSKEDYLKAVTEAEAEGEPGVGLGGDSSPRMAALQLKLEF